jgi:hypothetical protein
MEYQALFRVSAWSDSPDRLRQFLNPTPIALESLVQELRDRAVSRDESEVKVCPDRFPLSSLREHDEHTGNFDERRPITSRSWLS